MFCCCRKKQIQDKGLEESGSFKDVDRNGNPIKVEFKELRNKNERVIEFKEYHN